ncbi:MAG: hypothetical protein LBH59_06840 [Planctomycetaceae bacterium]|nr:hypothetical protein [Planctomycetaceae bacterium]
MERLFKGEAYRPYRLRYTLNLKIQSRSSNKAAVVTSDNVSYVRSGFFDF